jgi:hypothetical protein
MGVYKGSAGKTFTAQMRVAAGGATSATMAATLVLDGSSSNFHRLDPGGAVRAVTLPVVSGFANAWFWIANVASDAGEIITVSDADAAAKVALDAGETALLFCDGTAWYASRTGPASVPATASAIAAATTIVAADSGAVFSLAKTSAYAVTLPTPAPGLKFKFMVLDTGAFAVTFSDGSAHLFGQIQEAGTIPIAMTGTTITAVATQSVGDWISFEGIDATHYLVTGSSIVASKWTVA